jgi:hypothetical protein
MNGIIMHSETKEINYGDGKIEITENKFPHPSQIILKSVYDHCVAIEVVLKNPIVFAPVSYFDTWHLFGTEYGIEIAQHHPEGIEEIKKKLAKAAAASWFYYVYVCKCETDIEKQIRNNWLLAIGEPEFQNNKSSERYVESGLRKDI